MPRQCPECRSITRDDIGYCPACACQLPGDRVSSGATRSWQYLAAAMAAGSIAASIAYFWRFVLQP